MRARALVGQVKFILILVLTTPICAALNSQSYTLRGIIKDDNGKPIAEAQLLLKPGLQGTVTNESGAYELNKIKPGTHILSISFVGKNTVSDTLVINADTEKSYSLADASYLLKSVDITAEGNGEFGIARLNAVEGTAIYASKKNEVVLVDQLTANLAANLSRQVYAKVPGLNIWESDGAGVQLGIGGRGLSPNRNSNFNTRQNGYDISADALGYPESYYTPPVEAIERIEIVRGAASLQYGTQFGGMLNFRFKQGPEDTRFVFDSRQTIGSYGFFNSFNRIGGTLGDVNYTALYQYKHSDGWRSNSGLDQHMAYASFEIKASKKLTIRPEITIMHYLAQQPGGLTDAQFEMDPGQSNRERNWFKVNWNLASLIAEYAISDKTTVNTRFFGLIAGREALGILSNINIADFGGQRDLLSDSFRNWGNETRVMHKYDLRGLPSTALFGMRYYDGFTHRRQGNGNDSSGPDFEFLNPDDLEGSDFDLPSRNVALFAENIFTITEKLSVTPGVRFEYIYTGAAGYYRNTVRDLADNVLLDEKIYESRVNERSFLFAGIGASYRPKEGLEVYANISQNYRAINFNDIRVDVGNLVVDENLHDERGFNADIGLRGAFSDAVNYDVSLFHLSYRDRIGTVLKSEPNPNFNNLIDRVVRFRTNVADARILGFESYVEASVFKLFGVPTLNSNLTCFVNFATISAQYYNSEEPAIEGNRVELVPKFNTKTGINFRYHSFRASFQFTQVSEQFSDATNAIRTANAVEGIIPSYHVADLSLGYSLRSVSIDAGVNNLTNHSYFTRRASGYPGPGIIPSDPRTFYITLGIHL